MAVSARSEAELVGAWPEVVAFDVGDVDVDPERGGELAEPLGEPGRVEPAGVGDDLDAALDGEPERLLHLAQERLGEAERRVLGPVPAEDEHRQLGQVVAGEHVELAAREHLAHRGEAIAVEARCVGDSQRSRPRRPPLAVARWRSAPSHRLATSGQSYGLPGADQRRAGRRRLGRSSATARRRGPRRRRRGRRGGAAG